MAPLPLLASRFSPASVKRHENPHPETNWFFDEEEGDRQVMMNSPEYEILSFLYCKPLCSNKNPCFAVKNSLV